MALQTLPSMVLPRLFLRRCRDKRFRLKVADSTGSKATGGALLARTLLFQRWLAHHVLSADERFVGVLLPPSVAGVAVNAALPLCGKIGVNLNYTCTSAILNHCLEVAGIRHVLTSRKVWERCEFKLSATVVFLEDALAQISSFDKLLAFADAHLTPAWVLDRRFGLGNIRGDDVMTIIFTSGSTGMPKGVMLTYDNVGTNVQAIQQAVQLNSRDVLCGVLPLFHSFGYTVTLWAVLGLDLAGIYHFSPLDAKVIGKLCRDYRATILMVTPTFLRGYLRRCAKEDFATLEVIVTGAEKLPTDLAEAFEEKFGIRPVEGYGTTELSPVVAVNIPPNRAPAGDTSGLRVGSVGRPVPDVQAKTVQAETGEPVGPGEPGMLLVKGPNVMKGYLGQPELTARVLRDGWYTTGDMAVIDRDGFVHITGRLSRFSKIGGEMVPHVHLEELIQKIVAADEQSQSVAVTAVPDERKGERLVVLHAEIPKTPEAICRELAEAGIPNLWIPSPDSFVRVEQIPLLGTGKLDLQAVRRIAEESVGAAAKR